MAALAVSALTAVGQNVYSLNIVGYVNVPMLAGNYTYVNPLDKDGTNSAAQVLSLPDGTTFAFWTGSSFDYWYFDNSAGLGSPDGWYGADQQTPRAAPILSLGKGFYLNPPLNFTNTFVGNVVPAPGATNSLTINAGNQLVGSPMPVGGPLTNTVMNVQLFDGTTVANWTGSSFQYWYFDNSAGLGAPDGWYAADQQTPSAPPSLNVGRSLYINGPAGITWRQWLP